MFVEAANKNVFTKPNLSIELLIFCTFVQILNSAQVVVKELNFVTRKDTNQISQEPESAVADPTVGTPCNCAALFFKKLLHMLSVYILTSSELYSCR